MAESKRDGRTDDDSVVDPAEDLALSRKPDGEVAIMDAALGDWSTSPDLRNDASGVQRAGHRAEEQEAKRSGERD